MEYYHIEGEHTLEGEYRINGAKNSVLPIMAACLCCCGIHEICECPDIEDVHQMEKILCHLGCTIWHEDDRVFIDSRCISDVEITQSLMNKMRSSMFLMGSLLARCGEAEVYRPGGCRIGKRPIDIHIEGLKQIGYEIDEQDEKICCKGTCKGGRVVLSYPSVGATENLMMAALSGTSETIIENCAREPEIEDLAGFLQTCGFVIDGAGTDRITVHGAGNMECQKGIDVKGDTIYFVMEDRIEAATYMMAVAATGGRAVFSNIRAEYIRSVLYVMRRMGAFIRNEGDRILIKGPERLAGGGITVTSPYPGFPTDCQPQLMSIAAAADGLTTIREEIFESRFTHKKDLIKMGADIETCGKNAIIKGVPSLVGCEVKALDLRGGAALVIAGLMAEGNTTIKGINHIERGYADLEGGLRSLGGKIEKKRAT